MALVQGTSGNDLIHREGDFNQPSAGMTEIFGVTVGDDILDGGDGDDAIYGAGGLDIVSGGNGNDTVSGSIAVGGDGNDTLYGVIMVGGRGDDFYPYFDPLLHTVQEFADGGTDTIRTAERVFVIPEWIENLTFLEYDSDDALNVTYTGNSLDNVITGGAGNDILDGGAGADTLDGGGGFKNRYYVDNIGDRIVDRYGGAVYSTVDYVLDQKLANLYLRGRAISGTGNEFANFIEGNERGNVLDGGAGVDVLRGGKGDDRYIVDNLLDQVLESSRAGSDTVQSSVSFTLGQNFENLTLTGSASSNATGNESANILIGNDGRNELSGGLGLDRLTGGSGADSFVFDTKPNSKTNFDKITDFSVADDTIKLKSSQFTALSASGTLSNKAFKDLGVEGAKVDATDRIIYNNESGNLRYDPDGSGKAEAVFFAHLDNTVLLSAADFLMV